MNRFGISRDSAVGRGVATFIQSLLAFIVGLYAIPGVKEYVANKPSIALVMSFLVGLASLVNNVFRKSVPNV